MRSVVHVSTHYTLPVWQHLNVRNMSNNREPLIRAGAQDFVIRRRNTNAAAHVIISDFIKVQASAPRACRSIRSCLAIPGRWSSTAPTV